MVVQWDNELSHLQSIHPQEYMAKTKSDIADLWNLDLFQKWILDAWILFWLQKK